jgi:hypothetical protein
MAYKEALEAAGAEVLAYQEFGSYQGDWWAKIRYEGQENWVHGFFGSCSVCDAFMSEFGYDSDKCVDHEFESSPREDCQACVEERAFYHTKLIEFGLRYIEDAMTQEKAIEVASRDIEWDLDANFMVDFISSN